MLVCLKKFQFQFDISIKCGTRCGGRFAIRLDARPLELLCSSESELSWAFLACVSQRTRNSHGEDRWLRVGVKREYSLGLGT